ncbi:DNA ligase [Acidobacteria bacterium Mor1]|nr:DNA ligase [Acidobacteria bacterium Mor1]
MAEDKEHQGPRDPLADYRAKRSADATPEPYPGRGDERPGLFVVQKHDASHLHFDLRLEMDGVLQSWAVPKGPSLDPEEKRLAMKVEHHPIEYADFEGIIPEGNYGAGAVVVWDKGLWVPVKDPKHGLEQGKLLFDLYGYKLRGRWTLFKTQGGPNHWMIVKKPDGYADPDNERPPDEGSIFSGLTVQELKAGVAPADKVLEALEEIEAPEGTVNASKIDPMLATAEESAFSDDAWLFELKYDGYRLIAARDGGEPYLRYRRGQEVTSRFPELATALRNLPYEGLVLDGELVVLDGEGKPSFQKLQQRVQKIRKPDIQRASVRLPATLFAFDVLAVEGHDLRELPLTARKQILRLILPQAGPIRYSDHIEGQGEAMYEQVRRMNLEGIVAKKADSTYQSRRSTDWLKIRSDHTSEFVIVGYTAGDDVREGQGFGALHLAVWDGDHFVYCGRVGTGFDSKGIHTIYERIAPEQLEKPDLRGTLPGGAEHVWVKPELVAEVRYKEWTDEGNLRHPVFLRLRDDKSPKDCVPIDGPRIEIPEDEELEAAAEQGAERVVPFTNLDKVFWPEEGYTKGDLIEFYRRIAPWLLVYLRDRPLVLTRYPDGIEGKNFFQKDAPSFVPDWIRLETMWSEHAQREIRYFIADDIETLLYLANMGTIPLHVWSSRVSSLQHPDWCILDLDPKEAPFSDVVAVAKACKELCDEIELPCYVKTSGSSGLHVLIPLAGQCTYEQSRLLGQLLSQIVSQRHRDIATIARAMNARKGRVYLDWVQNGSGRLLVSPFCVRPLPGAPVSTPLRWSEVNGKLDLRKHTIHTVPKRFKRMKQDPLAPVLEVEADLVGALARLAELMG